ncbi:MAG: hypothetical protein ACRYHA_07510 [Janthinobacterium lividum]
MAFTIAQSEHYSQKISVGLPDEKGRIARSEFKVTFVRCNNDRLDELRTMIGRDVLKAVVIGWSDLVDDHDEPVPFSDANLDALMQIPQAADALIDGFWSSQRNVHLKN